MIQDQQHCRDVLPLLGLNPTGRQTVVNVQVLLWELLLGSLSSGFAQVFQLEDSSTLGRELRGWEVGISERASSLWIVFGSSCRRLLVKPSTSDGMYFFKIVSFEQYLDEKYMF